MEEFEINEYEVTRFSAKMYLDTFTFDLYNSFESSADKKIERLIGEIDKSNEKYKDLAKNQTEEKTEQELMYLEVEQHYCLIDNEYIREEIWALIEMKIIYAFKFLEINIKKLIRTSFSGTKTNDFYKWNLLNSFLKSKNIRPENLKGFQEVIQLKDVNNTLKHSEEFNEEIKKRIPEFRNKKSITFSDLNSFYKNQAAITKNLEIISGTVPEGVYLTSLSYQSNNSQIIISGFSEKRESLFQFKRNLNEVEDFSSISLPPSTWIDSTNINFNLSFRIEENEENSE